MTKMSPVVHFEMPYDDRARMAKFYQDTFGWQTQMLGEVLGEPMHIPGIGQFVAFLDTEGNRASMLQPDPLG